MRRAAGITKREVERATDAFRQARRAVRQVKCAVRQVKCAVGRARRANRAKSFLQTKTFRADCDIIYEWRKIRI